MKRSLRVFLALALTASTITVETAQANDFGDALAGGLIGGVIGGLIAGAITDNDRRYIDEAYPIDDEYDVGYSRRFEGDNGLYGNHEVLGYGSVRQYRSCRKIRTTVYNGYGDCIDQRVEVVCNHHGELIRIKNGGRYFTAHSRHQRRPRVQVDIYNDHDYYQPQRHYRPQPRIYAVPRQPVLRQQRHYVPPAIVPDYRYQQQPPGVMPMAPAPGWVR